MFTESVRIGCGFPAKYQILFGISPTLHDSVSGLCLCPPGNHPVMDLYSLSVTLPVLSYTVTVLS